MFYLNSELCRPQFQLELEKAQAWLPGSTEVSWELAVVSPWIWMDDVERKYSWDRTCLFIGFVWDFFFLRHWLGKSRHYIDCSVRYKCGKDCCSPSGGMEG